MSESKLIERWDLFQDEAKWNKVLDLSLGPLGQTIWQVGTVKRKPILRLCSHILGYRCLAVPGNWATVLHVVILSDYYNNLIALCASRIDRNFWLRLDSNTSTPWFLGRHPCSGFCELINNSSIEKYDWRHVYSLYAIKKPLQTALTQIKTIGTVMAPRFWHLVFLIFLLDPYSELSLPKTHHGTYSAQKPIVAMSARCVKVCWKNSHFGNRHRKFQNLGLEKINSNTSSTALVSSILHIATIY